MNEQPSALGAALVQVIQEAMPKAGVRRDSELARRIGLTRSAVSKMMNGGSRISVERLEQIAAALGSDPVSMMQRAVELTQTDPRFQRALANLEPDEREALSEAGLLPDGDGSANTNSEAPEGQESAS